MSIKGSDKSQAILELCSVFKHDFNNAYVSLLLNMEVVKKLVNGEEVNSFETENEKKLFALDTVTDIEDLLLSLQHSILDYIKDIKSLASDEA
jgi:hypothetical protein